MDKFDEEFQELLVGDIDEVDYEYVYSYIYSARYDLECIKKETVSTMIKEKTLKNIARVLNRFSYNIYSIEWHNEEIALLQKHLVLNRQFDGYFRRLQDLVSRDNYRDIYKLCIYTSLKYNSNFDYLEDLSKSSNYSYSGFTYIGNKVYDALDFDAFFTKKMDGSKVKVKKME